MSDQHFDHSEIFQTEFKPLIDRINQLSRAHDIPYVLSIAYKAEPQGDDTAYTVAASVNASPDNAPDGMIAMSVIAQCQDVPVVARIIGVLAAAASIEPQPDQEN